MFSFYYMNLIRSSYAKNDILKLFRRQKHMDPRCEISPLTILTLFPHWPNNCLLDTKTDLSVRSCWLKLDSTDPWGLSFPVMRTADTNGHSLCYSRNCIWNSGWCTENTIHDPKRSGTDPAPPCLRPQEPSWREHGQCLNLVRTTSVLSFTYAWAWSFLSFHSLGLFPKPAFSRADSAGTRE